MKPLTEVERERIIAVLARDKPLREMDDNQLGAYMASCAKLLDEFEPQPERKRGKK